MATSQPNKEQATDQFKQKIVKLLAGIYKNLSVTALDQLCDQLLNAMPPQVSQPDTVHLGSSHWDASTTVLITYGDSIQNGRDAPLRCLHRFLKQYLRDAISCVHILPFYPYTSDDGFSVVDYYQVNPKLGDWSDIEVLSADYDIMFDAVVNHMSAASEWFREYLVSYTDENLFFQEVDSNIDLSQVTRPRASPLLKAVDTVRGPRHVWCTFSHDQVDLHFANPNVLVEVIKVFQHYLEHGARWFRLDAIAFIWKTIGTSCISLPEVHDIIRVMRLLLEHASPQVVIVTETNVPFTENLAYFGLGDEAHLIYNFSLPPLLLQCLLSQKSTCLKGWIQSLPEAKQGTTYLNFIASHDGIGLRPAEGLLTDEQLQEMKSHVKLRGGLTTDRQLSDGSMKTYEMNVSLFDALGSTFIGEDDFQVQRFIIAYAIAMGLAGIPGIYIHSFLATQNDQERYKKTGVNRALNRHEWDEVQLNERLQDENSHQYQVLTQLRHLLQVRQLCSAFHPNARQQVMATSEGVLGLERLNSEDNVRVICLYNITMYPQQVVVPCNGRELIQGRLVMSGEIALAPYEFVWIAVNYTY